MAYLVVKNVCFVRGAAAAAAIIKPYLVQIKPFSSSPSSSLKSIEKSSNGTSFVVDYLINSCGFSPERAISASRYVKFETPDKPDLVLAFFRNHGFTNTQISYLTANFPPVLLCNPEKTLSPKVEFLRSKGASVADIAKIISETPSILKRSLKRCIIPSFDYFSNLLRSEAKTLAAIKRSGRVLLYNAETYVVPNIEMLKATGVPVRNIEYLLKYNPRTLMTTCDKFKKVVEEVKKLGFDSSKVMFLSAVHALRSMKKSTWEKKIEVYKKWGWSDDDIIAAFRKNTWCMTFSEDKINSLMNFWVSKMGWEPSSLANRPVLIAFSLEKRIVPRCEVYKALVSKGLINPEDISFTKLLESPEKRFLLMFVNSYKNEAPELLKLYKEKLDLSK